MDLFYACVNLVGPLVCSPFASGIFNMEVDIFKEWRTRIVIKRYESIGDKLFLPPPRDPILVDI